MAKLTDKTLIKTLMKDYGYSRKETINGYTACTCYNSGVVIDGATVIEVIGDLNDEHDYGFENGDFSACRQAEKDGVKFINDIDGLEKGCYVDTPENREICIKGLQEHPEYRVENWLFNDTCSADYRKMYIETFGVPNRKDLTNEQFTSKSMEEIKSFLTSKDTCICGDVLAVLEYDSVDIELTDRGMTNDDNREFDYFCCIKVDGEWQSDEIVPFGERKPYEFNSLDELKSDMKTQLFRYLAAKERE